MCVLQEGNHYEQASDVRLQLKFFEQLDQMEKQRKEEQEREILMKAAKVKGLIFPLHTVAIQSVWLSNKLWA